MTTTDEVQRDQRFANIPVLGTFEPDEQEAEEIVNPGEKAFTDAQLRMMQEANPVPMVRIPGDDDIMLCYGIEVDGVFHRSAVVRELVGVDEEAMSKLDVNRNDYEALMLDLVVRRATLMIGDLDMQQPDNQRLMGKLLMGDRDLLWMQIMFATYGEEKEYREYRCPACQALNDFTINVRDLVNINGLRSTTPTAVVPLRGKKHKGKKVLVHYPTGEDQLFAWRAHDDKATMVEMNTTIIERCVRTLDGEPIMDRKDFALNLNAADRKTIVAAINDGPSVTFKEVPVTCSNCEANMPIVFGWSDLLSG